MPKREDLTGQKFGGYTFLEYRYTKNNSYWLCRCDCGTEKVVLASAIKNGTIKSCGCLAKDRLYEDLTNQKFNLLTVLYYLYSKNQKRYWLCICECGEEKIVDTSDLKSNAVKSCGCLQHKSRFEDLTNQRFNFLVFIRFCYRKNKRTYWLCKCDCGVEKILWADGVKRGRTMSCGCYNQKCRLSRKGKKSPAYRHDLTPEERKERDNDRRVCPKNWAWRKKVYKRDNYTCQCCGQHSGNLAAHHIYNFSAHKKLRYVTSNGITLCVNCHKEFHHQFGNKYTTKKQFNKFKKQKRQIELSRILTYIKYGVNN